MVLSLFAGLPCAALAQDLRAEAPGARTAGGAALPAQAVPGRLGFSATEVRLWSEPAGADPGDPGTLQRILLRGNGRLTLGRQTFQAERAVVTLQREGAAGGRTLYRVYAYLEEVDTPTADAAIAVSAERLPVVGLIAVDEAPAVRADIVRRGAPDGRRDEASGGLLARAADARARMGAPRRAAEAPGLPASERFGPVDPDDAAAGPPGEPDARATAPIFSADGRFFFAAEGGIALESGERDNVLVLSGGVAVQYEERRERRTLEITAERAVVFLEPGPLEEELSRFDGDRVRGIYLEGGVVATDGNYTLRAPRVYYDVRSNRALMVEAVFYTYSDLVRMPIYMRAEAIRQEAARQFRLEEAEVSNTAFFRPHLSLGANRVTVTQRQRRGYDGELEDYTEVDARNIRMLAGGRLPFFWWPMYRGDPTRFPLRNIGFEDSNRTGPVIRTLWEPFLLAGIEPPSGVTASLAIDAFFERGPGLGLTVDWQRPAHAGGFFGYFLPNDTGDDVFQSGYKADSPQEMRGVALVRERWAFAEGWTLLAQGSWISDPAFLQSLYPQLSASEMEFRNEIEVRRRYEQGQLSIRANAQAMDFIANEWLLQTPGYTTDDLPEAEFVGTAIDLLEDRPGLLTYFWEARASNTRFRFSEVENDAYGLPGFRSMRTLGIPAAVSLGEAQREAGLDEEFRLRFDTRHEITADLDVPLGDSGGALRLTPFVVGRFTGYDDDFEDYRAAIGSDEDSTTRFWGAAGVTVSTSFQRVNDRVDSRVFDLYRTRHIVEPSLTVWSAWTDVERGELPVYDDGVENLIDGTMYRVAIDQTWQTKRGGPGRWRSVDVLQVDASYVWGEDGELEDEERSGFPFFYDTPIGRWYDPRPELGVAGEFATVEAVWRATDALAFSGLWIYDAADDETEQTAVGAIIEHGSVFTSSVSLRRIESQDAMFIDLVAIARLTSKYRVVAFAQYNTEEGDWSNISAQVFRAFPNLTLGFRFSYDNIRGETGFGVSLAPFQAAPRED